ncbi:hypothetical protein GYMLUDRAFT_243237 [Collybiopsis luxurians FD-317 M1]|uniref:Snurportin-1 n=1 Tax=Collybiopsis luxurians FD-317 M1 TaxID=944289 RepID=A0A0D0CG28_9AGAR|nr:hypothetical protein GYMLUDRAFT_243237 [Collybiopsis luxurians FD-317 M1]
MSSSRKDAFKLPPLDRISQAARRKKALEDQKRKRALKFDQSRNLSLDAFAELTLGQDEDEDETLYPKVVQSGLASFASAFTQSKKKHSPKNHVKSSPATNARWADKCMYAELLEMSCKDVHSDPLPSDLHTSWVALSPVPVGKRCLAITREGPSFTSSKISLRSRLLGKPLLSYFPSTLPTNTILDCILDADWRSNGILHVLDVIRWKGQELADCEAGMRFWWRDTRLSELSSLPPPPSSPSSSQGGSYSYPYPTTLLAVPYHPAPLTIPTLLDIVVPAARNTRIVEVLAPPAHETTGDMDIDTATQISHSLSSDGLLLYVAEACYESGTSPLSSWVPLQEDANSSSMDTFEQLLRRRAEEGSSLAMDI